MAKRKPFLLRLDPAVHDALQMWARDELRSLNAQIEFLLRRDLIASKRLKPEKDGEGSGGSSSEPPDYRSRAD